MPLLLRSTEAVSPFFYWMGSILAIGLAIDCFFWMRERRATGQRGVAPILQRKWTQIHPRYLIAWFPLSVWLIGVLVVLALSIDVSPDRVGLLRGVVGFWLFLSLGALLYSFRLGDFHWLRSYRNSERAKRGVDGSRQ